MDYFTNHLLTFYRRQWLRLSDHGFAANYWINVNHIQKRHGDGGINYSKFIPICSSLVGHTIPSTPSAESSQNSGREPKNEHIGNCLIGKQITR